MTIVFKKRKNVTSTLTCTRRDGSSTWTKLRPNFEVHDLAHYVVETELGFKNAFYSLLAQGHHIEDFELPRNRRPEALVPKNLPLESLQTEHFVNLLLVHISKDDGDFEFLSMLKKILTENNLPFPQALDREKLDIIIKKLRGLLERWGQMTEGQILELQFIV